MRISLLLLLNLLAQHVSANDLLWEKLKTEADLVVLMRHTQPAGGNPLYGTKAEAARVNRC